MLGSLTPTKISEGFSRPGGESELPIDINYAKLNDWLADRKQLAVDWRKRLRVIQARAAELPGASGGLHDEAIDYFRVRATRDQFAEGAERNMLGQLKGDAGAWHKLVGAYEKGVWLGEAAQTLTRNVDVEVPHLKQEKARATQQLSDLQRRRGEHLQSATAAAAAYKRECRDLGIAGQNVDAELLGLGSLLETELSEAVRGCTADTVVKAVAYYRAFAAYAHGSDASAALPSLQAVQSGDQLPGSSDPPAPETPPAETEGATAHAAPSAAELATEAAAPLDISWDIAVDESDGADAAAPAAAGISWDAEVMAADTDPGGGEAGQPTEDADGRLDAINWDVQIDSYGDDTAASAPGIDWDISAGVDLEAGSDSQAADNPTASAGAEGGSASPLVSVLMHSGTARARLLDDLYELQAFLTQREGELASGAGEALSAVAPEAIQAVGSAAVKAQLAAVSGTVGALTGDRLKQLLLIQSSERHRSRLAQHLRQQGAKEAKFKQSAADTEAERVKTQRKLMADAVKLTAVLERTKMIQGAVENALAAATHRTINIIGEINQL